MQGFNVSPLPTHAEIGRPGFEPLESQFGTADGYGLAPSINSIFGPSVDSGQHHSEDDRVMTITVNGHHEPKPMAVKELNWVKGDLVMVMVDKRVDGLVNLEGLMRGKWTSPLTVMCVPRFNLMMLSPKGRSDWPGFNAMCIRDKWKFLGSIAEGKYDEHVGLTLNPMKRALIKLPQNGAREGDAVWLMLIKTPRSSVAEYHKANSYRAPRLRYGFNYSISMAKQHAEGPRLEFATSEPILTPDQVAAAIKNATKPFTRSERAYIDMGAMRRQSLAMATSTIDDQLPIESLEDGDPLVWSLVPWVGHCCERPPIAAYNEPGEWYGTVFYVGRYMHSTTGPLGNNPVLNARIHDYFHPQDNSDAFREEGKLVNDAEIMLLL